MVYQFSALSDAQAISFDPDADLLHFDEGTIAAADIRIAIEGSDLRISVVSGSNTGKDVLLLNTTLFQLATTNITFADASQLLYGDNSTAQSGDNNSNRLSGGIGRDHLAGFGGDDRLDGRGGADIMAGGQGNDWYDVDNAADVIIEEAGQGSADRVFASTSYTLRPGVAIEILSTTDNGATQPFNLTGNELANLIVGNAGNNRLNGAGGADTMRGLLGDDWYDVDNAGDLIIEEAGQGDADRIFASTSYTLRAGVAVEILSTASDLGTQPINLTGNELANIIFGNAGNNKLNGAGGADTMRGLSGDDWYDVDNAGDLIIEEAGQGNADRIFASTSYTLRAGVAIEILSTTDNGGTQAFNLTGNELANFIVGNNGNNSLAGSAGNDTLKGAGGNDSLDGGSGEDNLNGGDGADTLLGGAGLDWLEGGAGADLLDGGLDYGRALYWSSDAGVTINLIDGSASGGHAAGDTLANINGVEGSSFADALTGDAGSNWLHGRAGNDTVVGDYGADVLMGGDGSDVLANVVGSWYSSYGFETDFDADIMDGGAGDDWYFVGASDILFDSSGIDTVVLPDPFQADPVSAWTLGPGFENLYMDVAWLDVWNPGATGIGNSLDNVIRGTPSSDWIVGHEGNDTLISGGDGGLAFGDLLDGGPGDDWLLGAGAEDRLDGGAGADRLDGGSGRDSLTGGDGDDSFIFSSAPDPWSVDTVVDFVPGADNLGLDGSVHADLGAAGNFTFDDPRFFAGPGANSGQNTFHRVIYDTSDGGLWYDPDGSGPTPAESLAWLANAPTLSATDIFVI